MADARTAKGLKKIEELFDDLIDTANSANKKISVYSATRIIRRAQTYVPVRTGFLHNSAFVSKPSFSLSAGKVKTNFGFSAYYALAVHELSIPYLEMAIDELAGDLKGEISAKAAATFKRQTRGTVEIDL